MMENQLHNKASDTDVNIATIESLLHPKSTLEQIPQIIISGVAGSGKSHLIAQLALNEMCKYSGKPVIIVPHKVAVHNMKNIVLQNMQSDNNYKGAEYASAFSIDHKLVVTSHSFAFSIIEKAVQLKLFSMPKLLTASEFDEILSDIILGQIERGSNKPWPEAMYTALQAPGFIPILRDFLLRAGENFKSPEDIKDMSKRFAKPLWLAVAETMTEYQAINALQATAYVEDKQAGFDRLALAFMNSSELMEIAAKLINHTPELLFAVQQSYSRLFIDDVHSFTPDFGFLLQSISSALPGITMTTDRSLSPFSWRGADGNFIDNFPNSYELKLPYSHRLSPFIAKVASSLSLYSSILSHDTADRFSVREDNAASGKIGLYQCSSYSRFSSKIVELILQAHLNSQISWENIAIIARDAGSFSEELLFKLSQENIPYRNELNPLTLGKISTVQALNALLLVLSDQGNPELIQKILTSALFGITSTGAQKIGHSLLEMIQNNEFPVPSLELWLTEKQINEELASLAQVNLMVLIEGIRALKYKKENVSSVLTKLWKNAVILNPLFHSERHPTQLKTKIQYEIYAVQYFLEQIQKFYSQHVVVLSQSIELWSQYFVHSVSRKVIFRDQPSITLTSAHSSAGREWKYVIVVGLEEKNWPNPRIRSDLLDTQEFITNCRIFTQENSSILNKYEINRREERNLLLLALTRSTRDIDVVAINDPYALNPQVPSEFYTLISQAIFASSDLNGTIADPHAAGVSTAEIIDSSGFHLSSLTGIYDHQDEFEHNELANFIIKLRKDLDSENSSQIEHTVKLLAYFAQKNVIYAQPKNWYQIFEPTVNLSSHAWAEEITLNPSNIDKLGGCPLGWFLATLSQSASPAMIDGLVIHTAAESLTLGVSLELVIATVQKVLQAHLTDPQFMRVIRIKKIIAAINRLFQTFIVREVTYNLLEVEANRQVEIGTINSGNQERRVFLRGRIDRIEQNRTTDNLGIVDIKTGKSPLSLKEAEQNLQMLAYRRMLDASYQSTATLYYPNIASVKPTFRSQMAASDISEQEYQEKIITWDQTFLALASLSMGSNFLINSDPNHNCAMPSICALFTAMHNFVSDKGLSG